MVIKNIYQKSIPCMNKTIKYEMLETFYDDCICYGIQIKEFYKDNYFEELIEDISSNKAFVNNLITYLYENAVDTVHFKDIIEDYIVASDFFR